MSRINNRYRLHRINQLMIAGLTVTALLMDGYQNSDVIFALSAVIWIWLQECDHYEEKILNGLCDRFRLMKNNGKK